MKKYMSNNQKSELTKVMNEAAARTEIKECVFLGEILIGTEKLKDVSYYNQFAAIRGDKRLTDAFLSYESSTAATDETALDVMRDFLHCNYNYRLRDDLEQFSADYEKADNTTITTSYDDRGIIISVIVTISGEVGAEIDGDDIDTLILQATVHSQLKCAI